MSKEDINKLLEIIVIFSVIGILFYSSWVFLGMDEIINNSKKLQEENTAIYNFTTTSYYINNPCDNNNTSIADIIQVSPTTYYYFEEHNLTCESYIDYITLTRID